MFLDFAEDQARRRKQVFLSDWKTKLDEFLRFNERAVLGDAGTVSQEAAELKAGREYEAFSARRRLEKEAEGGEAAIRALEATAKALQVPKAHTSSGDTD